MVVNSFPFLFFFIAVFIVYYLPPVKKNKSYQTKWLFLCSYFFYGYADLKMLPLLLGSTVFFYFLGNFLKQEMDKANWKIASYLCLIGVGLGVGVLLTFKYLNFFTESICLLLNTIGFNITWSTFNIIVPIGVSFFTFKLIGYIIDIYQESIEPSKSFFEFATYIAFFPTILSGPIDRANTFLPQLRKNHNFDYSLAVDGSRQILWGMFIKMCIADNLALGTDAAWANYESKDGLSLIILGLLYFIQLYTDFSGYSHMAIGVGKLLGFRITRNFNHPLLARNVSEYWRRWHMSLTNWITDYIYIPLNFSLRKYGKTGVILAILINLIIIGLWHGANWTYVIFGLYYGVLFIPLVLTKSTRDSGKLLPNRFGLPKMTDFIRMSLTLFIVSLGALIFRAPTMTDAVNYCFHIVTNNFVANTSIGCGTFSYWGVLLVLILDWYQRNKEHELDFPLNGPFKYRSFRWCIYSALILLIISFKGNQAQFIYFQF